MPMANDLDDRIVIDPAVRFGRPVVKGTRIAVEDVLDLIAGGLSFDQILKDCFPHLTRDDLKACVHYASQIVKGEDVRLPAAGKP